MSILQEKVRIVNIILTYISLILWKLGYSQNMKAREPKIRKSRKPESCKVWFSGFPATLKSEEPNKKINRRWTRINADGENITNIRMHLR